MAKNENGKLPAGLAEAFEADSGFGFEEVTSSDLQIPFLRIIQALSPQLKKSDAAFIEGAGQGDIFNTVTSKVWEASEGVLVLPVFFQMKFLEFVPRSQGGGFEGELSADSAEVTNSVRDKDSGMELLANGNELVRTAQHYIKIVHEDGNLENAIVDMKKTQLKKSRLWLSMMMMQKHNGSTLPSFANTYRLRSVEDGNDKGSWGSWSISLEGQVSSLEAYNDCKELYGSISSGELKIAPPTQDAGVITDQSSVDVPF
jgi:hypothetical protein|tara:strand:- start:306 stop:1079 length:774 start_codon:yes stop_codon:yes gene_type:complete